MRLIERAVGVGASVVGSALDFGRNALGRTSRDEEGADAASEAGGAASTAPETAGSAGRSEPKADITDTALARKVESEIFRAPDAPKDKVDVNAVDRVVYLRGEAKTPELIKELEAKAAAIPEVKRVENLLHLPKTPSPTRSDTPPRQRKSKTTQGKPPSAQRRRVNAEKPTEGAEPGPKDLAEEGSGRQPAPLGSQDPGESGGKD